MGGFDRPLIVPNFTLAIFGKDEKNMLQYSSPLIGSEAKRGVTVLIGRGSKECAIVGPD